MAGHSQFKNIMHRKGAQDAKRAKVFTKLIREIITSARSGLPDPAFNSRLRGAISSARALNLPKDKIDAALKKAISPSEGENYEEIRYEGYAPGGVAIIVEALTDNRNRTASEIRAAFSKHGGSLAETGSVSFMFDKIGLIQYPSRIATTDQMFEAALEAGSDDCSADDEMHTIICGIDVLNEVRDSLAKKFGDPDTARFSWKPQNEIIIDTAERAEKLIKMIDILEDNDDVQYVCGNYTIPNYIVEKLS